jgi:hypothetical protein
MESPGRFPLSGQDRGSDALEVCVAFVCDTVKHQVVVKDIANCWSRGARYQLHRRNTIVDKVHPRSLRTADETAKLVAIRMLPVAFRSNSVTKYHVIAIY